MARLYADENFPLPAVVALRGARHDVLTVLDAGQANRAVSDEELLAFATGDGRAIITLNRRHFIRLHRQRPDHAGIVVCTFDLDFEELAVRMHGAGRLVRIQRPGGAPESRE